MSRGDTRQGIIGGIGEQGDPIIFYKRRVVIVKGFTGELSKGKEITYQITKSTRKYDFATYVSPENNNIGQNDDSIAKLIIGIEKLWKEKLELFLDDKTNNKFQKYKDEVHNQYLRGNNVPATTLAINLAVWVSDKIKESEHQHINENYIILHSKTINLVNLLRSA